MLSGTLSAACPIAQWGPQKIQAPAAWDVTQGSASVSIAIVDTGVAFGHPDLLPNYGYETDFTGYGNGDGCPLYGPGHATHVAGIAAAATNNGQGIAGISWHSKIRSYRVGFDYFDPNGQVGICAIPSDLAATAIRQAADDGAQIINMSFGGGGSFALYDAVAYANSKGSVLVGAAGNGSAASSLNPAGYPNVISVAASDQNDGQASFTNYGFGVDIAAPGTDIVSTIPPAAYASYNGTSMATPFVSGVAALLASRGFFSCEIRETILGVTSTYPNGGDPALVDPINWQGGVGRLNAGRALTWWDGLDSYIVSKINWPNGAVVHGESGGTRYLLINGAKWPVGVYGEQFDQCIPQSLLNCMPTGPLFTDDPDQDGRANSCDNCPNWFNPAQDLPQWWSVPAGDTDCDGFPDSVGVGSKAAESFIGTDPMRHCAATSTPNDEPLPDAWPFDFNNDQLAGLADTSKYSSVFGSHSPGPPYAVRFDLNGDGLIGLGDVSQFSSVFGKRCSP